MDTIRNNSGRFNSKEYFWNGMGTATSVFSDEGLNDIKKIVKSLEDNGLLLKGLIERIKVKEQEGGFLGMLLGTLRFILLRNILTGRGVMTAG